MEQATNEANMSPHHNHQPQPQPPPAAAAAAAPPRPHHPPPPQLKCPRCDSSNTKFCYYNNYSLSQPRYFCKACRRYWTHGGTLRNVPVGGGCRKNRRPPSKAQSSSSNPPRSDPIAAARAQRPPSQTPMAVINSVAPPRPLPPVIPSMSNSFFGGSPAFLPSFAAMQPPAAANLGGGSQFGANMSLLQAMSLQSLKPPAGNPFVGMPTNLFPAQPNLVNPPSIRPWTQAGSSSSAVGSNFWNSTTGFNSGGSDLAGPSSGPPNQWSTDNHPGFNQ